MINEDIVSKVSLFDSIIINTENAKNTIFYPGPITMSDEYSDFVGALIKISTEKFKLLKSPDFSLEFGGIRYRCNIMPTVDGCFAILRKMPKTIKLLSECGFDPDVIDILSGSRLSQGGIVIISGMPGNGKSTTCSAIISERLKKFSGLCVTIEDPIEMPLHGAHNLGVCLQRSIKPNESLTDAVRDSMRAYPAKIDNMMLIGEVRDSETAALALRSAVDGRLIIISVHAGSVVQAIQRLLSSVSEKMPETSARNLLASGLRVIIHQKIVNDRMTYTSLFDTVNAASQIRNTEIPLESLSSEIEMQRIRIKTGKKIDLRSIN
jgi:twitching motility protein PilT